MKDLITTLCSAWGPSGFEEEVRDLVRAEVEAFADDIMIDSMGNLIVHKHGNGQKVMLAAHLDEIGIMVNHIEDDGYLRFTNLGGVGNLNLSGTRVKFANGTIGVIFAEKRTDRGKVHGLDKHFIDVGATSKADCPIEIGDVGAFWHMPEFRGDHAISKSLDDRIGCVVLIETLRRLKKSPHDLYCVFTVQEEIGVRGATVAAQRILPDVGIALDVTWTGDTPSVRRMDIGLGKGPAIKIKDAGMIAHHGLVKLMRERAVAAKIPYQNEVLLGGSTDARAMQVSGAGAIAGTISIPCRYVHSPSEIVSLTDVENSIKLLLEILQNPIDL